MILMLLVDTGARRAELVDLTLAHVDLDLDVLLVLGRAAASGRCRSATGSRRRPGPLPSRPGAPQGRRCPGMAGAAGPADQMGPGADAAARGEQAGLPGLHPHQLRHTFAHQWPQPRAAGRPT